MNCFIYVVSIATWRHGDMATCRPTLFLLTVKEILFVHFIITNFRVAHKMLCTIAAKILWSSLFDTSNVNQVLMSMHTMQYSAFFLTVAIGNCMVKLIPPVNFCSDENIQTIFGTKLEDFLNYRIVYNSIS
jgi:hypothetical protein